MRIYEIEVFVVKIDVVQSLGKSCIVLLEILPGSRWDSMDHPILDSFYMVIDLITIRTVLILLECIIPEPVEEFAILKFIGHCQNLIVKYAFLYLSFT